MNRPHWGESTSMEERVTMSLEMAAESVKTSDAWAKRGSEIPEISETMQAIRWIEEAKLNLAEFEETGA